LTIPWKLHTQFVNIGPYSLSEDVPGLVFRYHVLKETSEPREYDRADTVQRRNLETFEKVYESARQLTTNTVHQLVWACTMQCSIKGIYGSRDALQTLQYILNVIYLSQNTLLRMCLFVGLESDALQAYRNYFASEERISPKCIKVAQRTICVVVQLDATCVDRLYHGYEEICLQAMRRY
jgi:hypothetical protein